MTYEGFHGSREVIAEINAGGTFGGLFATQCNQAAGSHGKVLHIIVSPNHLTDFEMNYGDDSAEAGRIAMDLCDGDEDRARAILDRGCPCDSADPEDGLELQRLRGQIAARLGYTSVEMEDEHGYSVLCLPGCEIRRAD
jgi:hypothetical protein